MRNSFGSEIDYLEIDQTYGDIGDLAMNPNDGEIYGVASDGINSFIFSIDISDGSTSTLATLNECHIEGLTFNERGQLFGSTGSMACFAVNSLYEIDIASQSVYLVESFPEADIEAISCCIVGPCPGCQTATTNLHILYYRGKD